MVKAKPWGRLHGETTTAYQAFLAYRDLPPKRSVSGAGKALGKSEGTLERWSTRNSWVARAAAWDDHVAGESEAVTLAEAKKWARRRVENNEANFDLATKLRARVLELLSHPIVRKRSPTPDGTIIIEPAGWTQRDIPVMAKIASELVRLCFPQDPKAAGEKSQALEVAAQIKALLDDVKSRGDVS